MEDDCSEEEVDPRVKGQLEHLNSYTDEINSLELQLDEANATFRNTLSEYSQIIKQLAKKLGKCVEIARPYFEAEEAAQKAKLECEESAIRYHRACGIHKEARDTIALTEEKFNAKEEEYEFNAAWQEMLNRETTKLINAEALKEKSEKEHQRTTQLFAEAVQQVRVLEHKLKKDISKARIYFEQKKVFLRVLQDLKNRVESLQKAVIDSKASYANCLRNLEMISKEIHDRRKLCLPPREPGVGAERDLSSSHPDLSIYAPLADIRLTDTESEKTSLSSIADSEIPDDIKDICGNAFASSSSVRSPARIADPTRRTRSEPCSFASQEAEVGKLEILNDSNHQLPSSSVKSDTNVEDVPEVKSTDPNVFVDVDLSSD